MPHSPPPPPHPPQRPQRPQRPPLPGRPHLLVTRPQPQADAWVADLRRLGFEASAMPLLGIAEPADPAPVRAAWQVIGDAAAAAAAHTPHPLAVVMFVSPSAVQRFFAHRPGALAWPHPVLAAAPGQGTRLALQQAGVPDAALCSPPEAAGQFDSEALWAVLQPLRAWAGREALVVRGEAGRNWLADALGRQGAAVHFVEAYRRTAPVLDGPARARLAQALAQPQQHCWLLSSSEAVGHLPALAPGADWSAAQALATHARIAEAACRLGFAPERVQVVAPTPEAAVACLRQPAPPA